VKDTAAFYHAHRQYLFDGEMLAPGTMTCARRPVDFFIRGCYTAEADFRQTRQEAMATVLHGVWKARDGRTAAMLVNWTHETQPYRLETPSGTVEGSLSARSWLCREW